MASRRRVSKRHVTWEQAQEKCISILRASGDGNALDERDLTLVEFGLRRELSPLGVIVLLDIAKRYVPDKTDENK